MIIDTLIEDWKESSDGSHVWQVPENWMQGRSLFGGLTAAAAASLAAKFTERKLRTMQAQLIGPIVAGELRGVCTLLRSGKTTSFYEVRLTQDDELRALFVFIFIQERESAILVEGPEAPTWTSYEDAMKFPYIEGVTPEFTQNLDMRFAYGGIAFQGFDKAQSGGYLRLEGSQKNLASHQLALLDSWFPPVLAMAKKPIFGSTVTWTAHIVGESTTDIHQFKYDTLVGTGGFSTSVGHMWDATGVYVGYTEQTVVVFD